MTIIIILLLLIITLMIIALVLYYTISNKVSSFTQKYFGTKSLKEAIEASKIIESETPKSVASMENVYLDKIKHDFPEMNINEIKSIAEHCILDSLNAIEKKTTYLEEYNSKINSWINSQIEDLKGDNVNIDNVKFHRTVLNKYEKKGTLATLTIESSLEYQYKKGKEMSTKKQTRYRVEFIYIIDVSEVDDNVKALGFNCPNCGAPITTLGNKYCNYCGTGVKELISRVWTVNNINEH